MNARKKSIMSDLKKVDNTKEEDIDYTDSPPLDDSFFTREAVEFPKSKEVITIRVDHDVLDWFKKQGGRYQTRINAVLKSYMKAQKESRHKAKKKIKKVV
jgi:uncharacterized protein (DUF4415 family)